jgi:hypothetical protein
VKIKGTCKRDGREFFAEQVIELGGECPWDGEPFNADYAATLVESLREAERLGSGLERALERVASLHPAFTLDEESVLGELQNQLGRLHRNLVRRGWRGCARCRRSRAVSASRSEAAKARGAS